MSDKKIHILHNDVVVDHKIKLLCGASYYWTWSWKINGSWAYNKFPDCQVCVLLAMSEPENIYQEEEP